MLSSVDSWFAATAYDMQYCLLLWHPQVVHCIPGLVQASEVKVEAANEPDGAAEPPPAAESSGTVGHSAPVLCVTAHPSRPLLASGANDPDCTIKIWSAESS